MPGITLASGGTSTNGSTVGAVLSSGDHFNSGTESPLRVGETLRNAATNTEWEIIAITGTTANAFAFNIRPKQTITETVGNGSIFLFGGLMDVGEASSERNALVHLDEKYSNTVTEMREDWEATDLAEMTEIFYNSGASGVTMAGAAQAGTSYFTYKGLIKSNQRFVNNVEFKLMRGNTVTNSGLSGGSVGTEGFIPKVSADGQTVTYTAGNLDIAKMHEITRVMDINGCVSENIWLQDIFQRQSFSDSLFQQFPAGAWVWGENEKSQEAAINYGVQSLRIDDYMFKVKKYKNFNTEFTTGKTPTVDAFRNYGIICPQGETRDSRDASKSYKNMTIMYQQPPAGGTVGNGIRVWQYGGGSRNPTDGTMNDKVSMITYRGMRIVAANQFVVVDAA